MHDGYASTTGNVQTLTGASGTFAAGLSPGYLYQQGPDNYVDQFAANGGTLLFRDQSSIGRVVYHATVSSRTVCSAVIYGAMSQPARSRVMRGYTNYLLYGAGLVEQEGTRLENRGIGISPSPARGAVRFSVSRNVGKVLVCDAAGRLVAVCPVFGGAAVWNGRSSDGQLVPPGAYFCRAGDETGLFTVVR